MKLRDLRKQNREGLENRLNGARKELMNLKSQLSSGGSIDNPGEIKHLKKEIARIHTILGEMDRAE